MLNEQLIATKASRVSSPERKIQYRDQAKRKLENCQAIREELMTKIEGNKEIKEMLKSWKEVVASYLKMVKGIEDKEAELAKKQSEIYQIETSKTLKESVLELEKQKLNVLF